VLAALCCATASGCAQWQQQASSYADSLDQRLIAQCSRLIGEDASIIESPEPSSPARRAVVQASLEEPSMPTGDDSATPSPEPEDVAPQTAPLNTPADPLPKKPVAVAGASPCDVCCEDYAEGAFASCPVCGACDRGARCLVSGCREKLFTRPEPGPPPIRYRPPMPPKFLPVPTQPTISPARPDAPEPWRGDVEMSFRPQLTFPARD
jgi:hypothetical protein